MVLVREIGGVGGAGRGFSVVGLVLSSMRMGQSMERGDVSGRQKVMRVRTTPP